MAEYVQARSNALLVTTLENGTFRERELLLPQNWNGTLSTAWGTPSQGDLNGDGYADLVALIGLRVGTGVTDLAAVYLGSPSGLLAHPQYMLVCPGNSPDSSCLSKVSGDMLGDGTSDMVVRPGRARISGSLVYTSLLSGARSNLSAPFAGQDSGVVDFTAIGDVTGDGLPDLEVALLSVNLRNPMAIYSESERQGIAVDDLEVRNRGGRAETWWAVADVHGNGHVGTYVGSSLVYCTQEVPPGQDICFTNMPLAFELISGNPARLTNPWPDLLGLTNPQVGYYGELWMLGDINGDGGDDFVRPFETLCLQTEAVSVGYVCERSRYQDGGV